MFLRTLIIAISQINSFLKKTSGEFNWSKSTQGFVLSSYFYGYILTQVISGWLSLKFGGEICKTNQSNITTDNWIFMCDMKHFISLGQTNQANWFVSRNAQTNIATICGSDVHKRKLHPSSPALLGTTFCHVKPREAFEGSQLPCCRYEGEK